VPLEEQLRGALREAIADGRVGPGEELPSSRQLAGDLGIHHNTVARAYRRLRDEGLVVIGRGRGVLVRAREPETAAAPELRLRVEQKLRDAITEARLAGLPLERFEDLMRRQLAAWRGSLPAPITAKEPGP